MRSGRSRALAPGALVLSAIAAILLAAAGGGAPSLPAAQHGRAIPTGLSGLPLSAQGVVSATLGAHGTTYLVRHSGGALQARNVPQAMGIDFRASGVEIASHGTRVGVRLRGAGYGASLNPVGLVQPSARANRVTYQHAGLTEWYRNGPLGLEQGFTIARPLEGRNAGPLTLSMVLSGNVRLSLARDRQSVTVGNAGTPLLAYGALRVTDTRGRVLHSWLALEGRQLLLRADARGARYPLRVDPAWTQQGAKLTGSGEVGKGQFGYSVALSPDGNTALVGSWGDNGGTGAAWVFTRSGSTWTQQGEKLTGSGEVGEGNFGWSVALGEEGNTAVIGGPHDNKAIGAAWVFTRSGSVWTQQGEKLTGSGEVGKGEFGYGVALSSDGDTALVGGPFDNSGVGAAWPFTRSGSTWTQQGERLTGTHETGEGYFGASVALSSDGDTALIGGPRNNSRLGAAWPFTRSGSIWSQQGEKLVPTGEIGEGYFGASVALSSDGNTGLIGGPEDHLGKGAAWIFTRTGSSWSQPGEKLTGIGAVGEPNFGSGVALSSDGEIALIGGYHADKVGAAWVFTGSGPTWTQQGERFGGGEEIGHGQFGFSVALSSDGETALVGGPFDNSEAGGAWAFTYASVAPVVVTGKATLIGEGSATLNATANPKGGTVSNCHFNYGLSESYGSSMPCSSLPASGATSPVPVSAAISGLAAATIYHFQIVVTNEIGTSYGSDETFKTAAPGLPELGRCLLLNKPTGKYKSTLCTVKSTGENSGSYEWQPWPALKNHFSFKNRSAKLETAAKTSVKCTENVLAGEYDGPQSAAITITLGGCEGHGALAGKCQSEGAGAGEIVSNPLAAELGFIKTSGKPSVGWDVSPASGPDMMAFKCGAAEVALAGSVIAPVGKIDKMAPTFTLKFKAKKGKQAPEAFEVGPKDTPSLVTMSGEEQVGLSMTASMVNEEAVEIKAIV
jgi:hypothetical protein